MKIDDKKWDEFIKNYTVGIMAGLVAGFIVSGETYFHLKFLCMSVYLVALVMAGGILGYVLYSHIGIKSKPDNTISPPPPPSSPV
jgi:hypothetical protein